jgi:hypothetical protein
MLRIMNGSLFARPNLKWFLIGALLVAAVHQLTIAGHSEGPAFSEQVLRADYQPSDDEIQQLVTYAVQNPSSESYGRVAACYQKRGEIRKALLYLREAEKAGDTLD